MTRWLRAHTALAGDLILVPQLDSLQLFVPLAAEGSSASGLFG